jgi:hypothetical protein
MSLMLRGSIETSMPTWRTYNERRHPKVSRYYIHYTGDSACSFSTYSLPQPCPDYSVHATCALRAKMVYRTPAAPICFLRCGHFARKHEYTNDDNNLALDALQMFVVSIKPGKVPFHEADHRAELFSPRRFLQAAYDTFRPIFRHCNETCCDSVIEELHKLFLVFLGSGASRSESRSYYLQSAHCMNISSRALGAFKVIDDAE